MHGWMWGVRTTPFTRVDGGPGPARFMVEQIDDSGFRVIEGYGFQYTPIDGSPAVVVTSDSLPRTDFASIPRFMTWFASRYGRHTPAALVHDQLVRPGIGFAERTRADDRFLEMMDQLDVPPVRRSVMWSAVTLATRWSSGWRTRIGILVWGLAAACGLVVLVAGIATGHPWWCVASLAAPAPASLLWGKGFRAGLIGGYALPVVVIPALASIAGYSLYWIIEEGVRRLRSIPPSQDIEQLPAPTPYKEL